jgi:hypothetical protein
MATQVQFRGGTTSEHSSFNGAAREVTVDTTKQTLVVQDGTTNGGFPLLRESGTQNLTTTGTVFIDSNSSKLKLGDAGELECYHNGSHSYLINDGTNGGTLNLRSNSHIYLQDYDGNTMADFIDGGAVKLYYDTGTAKLETTASGAKTTGTLEVTSSTGIGTSSPRRHLHIHNSASATVGMMLTNGNTGEADDSQGFQFKVGSDGHAEISQQEDSYIQILTNGSNAMNITNDQKVGIGTTSADRILHVEGTQPYFRLTDSATSPSNGEITGMIEFETRDSNNPGVAANIRSELIDNTNGASSLYFSAGTPSTIGTKMEIQHGGDVKINDGNLVLADTHGISFHNYGTGTGVSSNLLDDYEEGSWTPDPQDSGGVHSVTGRYIKIGNEVHAYIRLYFAASTGTARVYINNLPFTVKNDSIALSGTAHGYGDADFFRPYAEVNTTNCHFYTGTGGNWTGAMSSNKDVRMCVIYRSA